MERIPVALSCDNRQTMAMAVVMVSAIKNADPDTFYEFYCLLSKDVSPEKVVSRFFRKNSLFQRRF
mgnify:CR=1 FL=1